ncbi:MAG TPA: NAD(P)/FAD-dependent oxidoreductase [Thermoanaerobaculia bacterium]|nr:NAD(P)/FAD-dependent oxidoreductase [Thermoanaerobaculia bacterium]
MMPSSDHYDVVVLGGAFSGAATALLLRRDAPALRVLVVEKATKFDEKVGEATTEMSAMFLTRRLAMWEHLEREQLPKEGLRYWFTNEKVTGHFNASESGGYYRSNVPSFQLRRDALDEHILATAVAEGAELARPARVKDVTLGEFDHSVVIETATETRTVRCRWIIDATGRVNFLGRKLGIIDRVEDHPTAAIWARWKNLRHIDDIAARGPNEFAARNIGSRRLGTNHYAGRGYWIWVIPLGNGETSVGLVFDKRLVNLHASKNRESDFIAFLKAIPALAELLEGATIRSEDLRFYGHLPYVTQQYMGNGWALVGDAAAFLDPYYSPGLDHAAFSAEATTEIVREHLAGKDVAERIAEHNQIFVRSYHRFFEAVYKDKYYYMGEHDLLSASFLLDTAQYYIFLVMPAYRILKKFFWMPVLGPKQAIVSYRVMRFSNRRFAALANLRFAAGVAGAQNNGRRISAYFNLGGAPFLMLLRGLKIWMLAELGGVRLSLKQAFRRKKAIASSAPEIPKTARDATM